MYYNSINTISRADGAPGYSLSLEKHSGRDSIIRAEINSASDFDVLFCDVRRLLAELYRSQLSDYSSNRYEFTVENNSLTLIIGIVDSDCYNRIINQFAFELGRLVID